MTSGPEAAIGPTDSVRPGSLETAPSRRNWEIPPERATDAAWELERRLSRLAFRGVPIGPGLSGALDNVIRWRETSWSLRETSKNRARYVYHQVYLRKRPPLRAYPRDDRVLVTWISPSFRFHDLVLPVAEHLGYENCTILYDSPEMAGLLPFGATGIDAQQVVGCYDTRAWRRDYARLWKTLKPELKRATRELPLPSGCYELVADVVVTLTQTIAGFEGFLRRSRIGAILTDFDRYPGWSPLVLLAGSLGLRTYTLVHGVFDETCVAYYPVLADKIFCWGRISEAMLVSAGVHPDRVIIGGCPRMTRDLPMLPVDARARIGLDTVRPVVVLANQYSPLERHQLKLAETFCRTLAGMSGLSGVVRLHPVDKIERYAGLMARFPSVRFMTSEDVSLDDTLAAADVVVVHSSGVGSDALVKRRLVVVLDVIDQPLQHGQDLVDRAGCPRATSVESLQAVLTQLFGEAEVRRDYERRREEYVEAFCAYYGDDSARRIADHVLAGG